MQLYNSLIDSMKYPALQSLKLDRPEKSNIKKHSKRWFDNERMFHFEKDFNGTLQQET